MRVIQMGLKIALGTVMLAAGYRLSPFFPDGSPIVSGLGFGWGLCLIHDAFSANPLLGRAPRRLVDGQSRQKRSCGLASWGFPSVEQMREERERWPDNPERWTR